MSLPRLLFAFLLMSLMPAAASAQSRGVTITIPSGVSFLVTNVAASTAGNPASMRISFTNTVNFKKNDNLNISVRADSANFAGPGTTRIPASKVSWTATTTSGTASNGTLSSVAYSQVYISPGQPSNGSVTLQWTLAPITAAGLRAGTHTLTVRWRLEVL